MISFKRLLINALFICYTEALLCELEDSKITCRPKQEEDLYSNITIAIHPNEVLNLNIKDINLPSVNRSTFMNYKNLHSLSLKNLQLINISKDTFADLKKLRNMDLSYNLIKNFDFKIFPYDNSLHYLNLSNNLLETLNGFDVDQFRSLKIMNISDNNLKFLPKDIMNKLKKDDEFFLIVDGNPWNCSETGWIKDQDATLRAALCADISDIRMVMDEEPEPAPVQHLEINTKEAYTKTTAKPEAKNVSMICSYETKCFSFCVFWFLGGIWFGIILGNICKINRMICRSSEFNNNEQNTQYDKVDIRSKD